MKTIATFSKPEEAHLLRMRLEDRGVPAYVIDENLIQADWFYSNAIGGVRVQVADQHLEEAMNIVAEPGDPALLEEELVPVLCPYCGSRDTRFDDRLRRLAFLAIFILRFPVMTGRHRYRCNSCSRVWNDRKRPLPEGETS